MKTVCIPTNKIHMSTFNPPSRTTPGALKALADSIKAVGILSPAHVVPTGNGQYALVDGHRRVSIAMETGVTAVDCIVHDVSADPVSLWAELNSKTRTVGAFEWMVAWHLSGQRMPVPANVKKNIGACVAMLGRDAVPFMIEHKASPTICSQITALQLVMEKSELLDRSQRGALGRWIVRHSLAGQVAHMLRIDGSKRVLKKVRTRFQSDDAFIASEIVVAQSRAA